MNNLEAIAYKLYCREKFNTCSKHYQIKKWDQLDKKIQNKYTLLTCVAIEAYQQLLSNVLFNDTEKNILEKWYKNK